MTETAEQRIRSLEQHLSSQPKSPLFAQLADYYLEAGRTKEALGLCDRGLAQYPFYTTGHLIKGKALLALNMKSEARREFEFVHNALPLNESINRILIQIPQGEEESFATPAGDTTTAALEPSAESAVKTPMEPPPSGEAASDQWMSQFTEAAVATTEAPPEIQTPPEVVPETSPLAPEPTETVADVFGIPAEPAEEAAPAEEIPPALAEGESFDQFAEGKRGELFGLENSLSLEEYLNEGTATSVESPGVDAQTEEPFAPEVTAEGGTEEAVQDPFARLAALSEEFAETQPEAASEDPFAAIAPADEQSPEPAPETTEDPFAQLSATPAEPEQAASDQIEEIAEKLKDAKRITPIINFSEKETTSASEAETPSGSGFVTPTLAEIYAKQGWYDDAIKAYKALAHSKPLEKEKFEKRIQELEDLKRQQDSVG